MEEEGVGGGAEDEGERRRRGSGGGGGVEVEGEWRRRGSGGGGGVEEEGSGGGGGVEEEGDKGELTRLDELSPTLSLKACLAGPISHYSLWGLLNPLKNPSWFARRQLGTLSGVFLHARPRSSLSALPLRYGKGRGGGQLDRLAQTK